MKRWEVLSVSDGIGVGVTEEGHQFIEIDIDGWNDEENFDDIETIETIHGTLIKDTVHISVRFEDEEMKKNERMESLIQEAIEDLKREAEVHFF